MNCLGDRLIYYRTTSNEGHAGTINVNVKNAQGDWIKPVDDDDYLGFAEKVLWVRVGVRSQESGVRRNGKFRGGRRKNHPLIFQQERQPKILTCMSSLERKPCTFSRPKKAKTLICQCF